MIVWLVLFYRWWVERRRERGRRGAICMTQRVPCHGQLSRGSFPWQHQRKLIQPVWRVGETVCADSAVCEANGIYKESQLPGIRSRYWIFYHLNNPMTSQPNFLEMMERKNRRKKKLNKYKKQVFHGNYRRTNSFECYNLHGHRPYCRKIHLGFARRGKLLTQVVILTTLD